MICITLVACQSTPTPAITDYKLLGEIEMSFGENGMPRASFTPSRQTRQGLVNESQLQFHASTFTTASVTNGQKYLNAQFTVRNLTGTNLNQLVLVAYRKTGNIGNSALKNITDFGGIGSTSVRQTRAINTIAYAQNTRPSHAMSGNGSVAVVAGQEDLALFTEYDIQKMTTLAGSSLLSGEYLLPYGFMTRSIATPTAATQRTITPSTSADTGTVTLAMHVDGSNEPVLANAYRFTFTALVFESPTPKPRVSESIEEQTMTSTANARQATLQGTGVSTEVLSVHTSALLNFGGYTNQNGKKANTCQVRIAGSAAAPEAFLEPVAPSSVVGRLDECFANSGARHVQPNTSSRNYDVGLLADGRFVSVGQYDIFSQFPTTYLRTQSYVGLYNPDASSIVETERTINAINPAAGNTFLNSVGVDSLGRVISAGYYTITAGGSGFALSRSLADATMTNDTTFSITDTVNTSIYNSAGSEHVLNDIAIQSDNKIVAVGYVRNGAAANPDLIVLRYNTNGTLDTSFNGTGYRIEDVDGTLADNQASSVVIDTNGNIVVAGRNGAAGAVDFLVMRFTSTGARDTTFNTTGYNIRTITGSTDDMANSVALQGTKIIVAGFATTAAAAKPLAMIRLNANGTLDSTFGTSGEVTRSSPLLNPKLVANKALVQSDNKIILVGEERGPSNLNVTIGLRYLPDGAADTTFNTDINGSNPVASNFRYYQMNSIAISGGLGAVIAGTPTKGKLIMVGFFHADGIVENWEGFLAQAILGAN